MRGYHAGAHQHSLLPGSKTKLSNNLNFLLGFLVPLAEQGIRHNIKETRRRRFQDIRHNDKQADKKASTQNEAKRGEASTVTQASKHKNNACATTRNDAKQRGEIEQASYPSSLQHNLFVVLTESCTHHGTTQTITIKQNQQMKRSMGIENQRAY